MITKIEKLTPEKALELSVRVTRAFYAEQISLSVYSGALDALVDRMDNETQRVVVMGLVYNYPKLVKALR